MQYTHEGQDDYIHYAAVMHACVLILKLACEIVNLLYSTSYCVVSSAAHVI